MHTCACVWVPLEARAIRLSTWSWSHLMWLLGTTLFCSVILVCTAAPSLQPPKFIF